MCLRKLFSKTKRREQDHHWKLPGNAPHVRFDHADARDVEWVGLPTPIIKSE